MKRTLYIFTLCFIFGLAGCGGGGGGGGGTQLSPPSADLSGSWSVTESISGTCPNQETSDKYNITVTQKGNDLTVVAPSGTFHGTISGNSGSWTGSYSKNGGTVTINSMTLTVSNDGNTLTGLATWAWSDGVSAHDCSGTTQISVARVSNVTSFTVTYNGNGNTGGIVPVDANKYQSGQTVTVRENTGNLTKTGYKFVGWNLKANSTGTTYLPGQTFSMPAADVILYAIGSPVPPSAYELTIKKAGFGSGTVTGQGLSCGTDCAESISSGTTVILTAVADTGSTFSGWTGCLTASGTTCTIMMDQIKSITATFGFSITSSITITDLPTKSTSGNYALSFSVTGLVSTPYLIQEAPDSSFSLSNRTVYSTYATTYNFTSKPDGVYCYRIATSTNSSLPACITVARSTVAVLRITNSSHYAVIDAKLNNIQKVSYPYGISPGQSYDFIFSASGTVSYQIGVGFYNSDTSRYNWFNYAGSTSVTTGGTTTLTLPNPTLAQLLTNFDTTGKDWIGQYWCYSCNPIVGFAKYHFNSNGNWVFYDNNVQKSTGTPILVSWPDYSSVISFKMCSTCDAIYLNFPFSTFYNNNGPADWPSIEYVSQ